MDKNVLKIKQNYPLEFKVEMTKRRIENFVRWVGLDNAYIAFSGGKDSTVLLHIARQLYPNIKAVFSNTGLEFPEIVKFAMSQENVEMIRPKKGFSQVIKEDGYPMISKKVSNAVRLAKQNIKDGKLDTFRVKQLTVGLEGSKFNMKKWGFLLDAPFEVTEKCCYYLKKEPLKRYEKETGRKPVVATMAQESLQRESSYLKTNCNSYNEGSEMSRPMSFWTEQDILMYLARFKVPYCSIYGKIKADIVDDDGDIGWHWHYYTTGEKRTGCIFCGFGVHLEKGKNRYQRLEQTHPKLHDYCMNKLGFKDVCEYLNIPYKNEEGE
ncbi:phosphoadenosine phosphosulfate reductase [Clostridium phage phiCP34O]|uniref:phosphoadenosine phosphosulfate reductase n=1 Tax=Clostridium phage phiCP13O TaxID=1042122 RepID=UPI000214C74A|nr:phosphoadenosine phosphosulfate reductase [Clostridium phage phiCP13O]YP_007005334.1 phosphoadenosine phosphosulfate reductase [Clostridium phage phiCP34O]AEI74434.1 3''-phosphoadenosine 5''-phosphosulfate sulfotransferase/FAD synthetase-related enzyme [Clostridium phage phiCP13O]AEI74488.1 3''-phosphoadenosine 5''-phosphosulfate sulfotransferase/FAD synthetase-related enzyme [Clostridium phage phiCP34O]